MAVVNSGMPFRKISEYWDGGFPVRVYAAQLPNGVLIQTITNSNQISTVFIPDLTISLAYETPELVPMPQLYKNYK